MAVKRKARRTAAQKRATLKMLSANRARRRKRNPSRAAAYRSVPTMANPIKRRRRRRARNPIGSVARRRVNRIRRRRNPIGGVQNLFMSAVTGAAGAIVLDVAFGYLPIPANLKTGPLKDVVKAIGAVGLTMIASRVVKKSTAEAMGIGALTVIAHDLAKGAIAKFAPSVKMDGMGDMGLYVNGLGYYSPAMPAGGQDALPAPGMGLYVNGYSGADLETEAGYVYN